MDQAPAQPAVVRVIKPAMYKPRVRPQLSIGAVYDGRPKVVPDVLDAACIGRLLHGCDLKLAASPTKGRKRHRVLRWPGALHLTEATNFHGKMDVVPRGDGRLDYTLSESLYEDLVGA